MTMRTINITDSLRFYSLDSNLKLVRKHKSFRAAARFVKRRIDKDPKPGNTQIMYVYEVDTKKTTFYSSLVVRAERGKSIKEYKPE